MSRFFVSYLLEMGIYKTLRNKFLFEAFVCDAALQGLVKGCTLHTQAYFL